jgi:hypothetical protein
MHPGLALVVGVSGFLGDFPSLCLTLLWMEHQPRGLTQRSLH